MTDRTPSSLTWRRLARDEIDLLWTIDRREVIERVGTLVDGRIVLHDEHYDMQGWPPGEREHAMPWLEASYDRGGVFTGVFDGNPLAGVAVVDTRRLGPRGDLLQLSFLHVGRDHRGRGLGAQLLHAAEEVARDAGAGGLYISATPSEHTIAFYVHRGCRPIAVPDPELFAREPEDIHFELRFARRAG